MSLKGAKGGSSGGAALVSASRRNLGAANALLYPALLPLSIRRAGRPGRGGDWDPADAFAPRRRMLYSLRFHGRKRRASLARVWQPMAETLAGPACVFAEGRAEGKPSGLREGGEE